MQIEALKRAAETATEDALREAQLLARRMGLKLRKDGDLYFLGSEGGRHIWPRWGRCKMVTKLDNVTDYLRKITEVHR